MHDAQSLLTSARFIRILATVRRFNEKLFGEVLESKNQDGSYDERTTDHIHYCALMVTEDELTYNCIETLGLLVFVSFSYKTIRNANS